MGAMPGKAKPQGILPYVVEVTEQFGHTTARAGLPLVVETMRALGTDRAIEAHMRISAVAERLVQIIASRHRLAVLLPVPE